MHVEQPPVRLRHTTTVEEQSTLLAGWNQRYAQLSRGAFTGMLSEARLPDAYLFREVTSRSLLQGGIVGADVLAVGIPVAIKGPARFCGSPCGGHQLHVFSGDEGFQFHTPSDLDIMGIVIPRAALYAHLDAPEVQALASRLQRAHLLDLPPALFVRLGRVMRDLMEGMAEVNDIMPLLAEALATPAPVAVTPRAADLVDDLQRLATDPDRDQPPSIHDACETLGVSRRTLQYALQKQVGLGPSDYMRALRLNAARASLLDGDTVTEAATKAGFWHFGRFSQDYRKLFGELPSATLQRAR
ncbi:helix-turn-helix domain-containing protein [Paracoccus indicus]|uniref:helix-turn-helix domain-containing protein n=1 Tax=Paracoccus indicus TaxID=2079229 RepID=UPI000D3BB23D|nr:helix-turn-helix domain-containing protein [Paracoccus indicus]